MSWAIHGFGGAQANGFLVGDSHFPVVGSTFIIASHVNAQSLPADMPE
jgi:hypothetical protein